MVDDFEGMTVVGVSSRVGFDTTGRSEVVEADLVRLIEAL